MGDNNKGGNGQSRWGGDASKRNENVQRELRKGWRTPPKPNSGSNGHKGKK